VEIGGIEALEKGSPWAYRYLRTRANSIEGGTSDVLRNIVAERVLGLPKLR
jgi:alkylation response protein AidB-like acyl-CoA dehydrogenase